jgi:hypothetical protein
MLRPTGALLASLYVAVLASPALAAGPFGSIHVGNWSGGAYTNDKRAHSRTVQPRLDTLAGSPF